MNENGGTILNTLPDCARRAVVMDIERLPSVVQLSTDLAKPSKYWHGTSVAPQELCARCSQINWTHFLGKNPGVATQIQWGLDLILRRAHFCRLCRLLMNLVLISFGTLESLPSKVVADTYFKPRAVQYRGLASTKKRTTSVGDTCMQTLPWRFTIHALPPAFEA